MTSAICKVEERYGQLGETRLHFEDDNASRQARKRTSGAGASFWLWLQGVARYVLLPQGFPDSVSDDYLEYQMWDTLQAFCSYLSGTLTTKAIMQGVGVGDAAATPLAATLTWILRDGTGMVGRILFATWKGPELDTNCKKWRLAADILNDMAMSLELCSPLLPESYFATVLCLATSMKAIVGVAGGATRAALTQHQARQGNMADVAAKDGSQETLVNLIASNIGIFLLPLITEEKQAWLLFSILTCIHLFANYRAVRCLNIPILNDQRYNILYQSYNKHKQILPPKKVNVQEPVFLGQNRYTKSNGWVIKLGESLSNLPDVPWPQINHAASLNADYLILVSPVHHKVAVIFKKGVTPDALKSQFNAMILSQYLGTKSLSKDVINKDLTLASEQTESEFAKFRSGAVSAGWHMNKHQLLVDEWVADWSNKKED